MTYPPIGSYPVRAFTEGSNSRTVGARLCYFRQNSAELLPEHKLWIDEIFIPKIKNHPNAWVDFLGSASRTGTPTGNYALSRLRNDKVEEYIKKTYPEIKVNVRVPLGADSESLKDDRKNSEGYYRAVVIRWYGIPLQIPVPVAPPEAPYKFRKYKAPEGCWLITGVDASGFTVGLSVNKASIKLLNDKGESYTIEGIGAGLEMGPDIGPEIIEKLITAIKLLGISEKLSDWIKSLKLEPNGPTETAGGIFRNATRKANLTIDEIKAKGFFTIGSGELHFVAAGGEIGLIHFGIPGASIDAVKNLFNTPFIWGFFVNLGLGTLKGAVGVSGTIYKITNVKKES